MPGVVDSVTAEARAELLALLHGAREHPDDVSRRLVLADWLEEFGDTQDSARAEFVRLQCRLEPDLLPDGHGASVVPVGDAQRVLLTHQEDQLVARHEREWLSPLSHLVSSWEFRRGMVWLGMDGKTLPRRAVIRLAGTEPWAWVEGIHLLGSAGRHLAHLMDGPHLESVTALRFSGDVPPAEMRSLVRMPWFAGLRSLNLAQTQVREQALACLADAPGVSLEHLGLAQGHVTPHGLEQLGEAPFLDQLITLDLRHNRLGDRVVEWLLGLPRLRGLTHLLLAGNRIGPRGSRLLARCRHLDQLIHLDLGKNPLGDEGAAALAAAPWLGGLVRLDLGACRLTEEGAEALFAGGGIDRLTCLSLDDNEIRTLSFLPQQRGPGRCQRLNLSGNPLGSADLAPLTPLVGGPLRWLSLARCEIGAEAIETARAWAGLNHLTDLDLGENPLGRAGLRALTRGQLLDRLMGLGLRAGALDDAALAILLARSDQLGLTCLDLADNQVTAEGAGLLAQAETLASLVALDLDGNSVGDGAAVALVESPVLGRLSQLSLRDCDLTDNGVMALAGSPGLSRITRLALGGAALGPMAAHALLISPYTRSLRLLDLQAAITDPHLKQALKRRFPGCQLHWPIA